MATTPRDEERPPRETRTPRAARARAEKEAEPKQETPKPKVTPTNRKLKASVQSTYESVGLLVIGVGMSKQDNGLIGSGQAITTNAEAAADAWLELADQNPAVKRAMQRFAEGSAVATLVTVHVGMLLPLAASRGVIPAAFMGMPGMAPTEPEPTAAQNGNGN